MANLFIDLDLGGAPSDVAALGKTKTINTTGDFTGQLVLEAKCDGDWAEVLRFNKAGNHTIDAVFKEVRLNTAKVSGGSVDSASISANDTGGKFVTLPTDGTVVDVSALGTFNTVIVTGAVKGQAKIQISDDGVDFTDWRSFQNETVESGNVVTQFMRVEYSGNATPVICVGASNETDSTSTPVNAYVWRPGAMGSDADGENVYTDWTAVYNALQSTKDQGPRELWFDSQFSPDSIPAGATVSGPTCEIPAGTWDMTNVEWRAREKGGPLRQEVCVSFAEGAFCPNLERINLTGNIWHAGLHTPLNFAFTAGSTARTIFAWEALEEGAPTAPGFVEAAGTVTMTAAPASPFTADLVGKKINIVGSTTNDGKFVITAFTATTLSWVGTGGVTEAEAGTYLVEGAPLVKLTGTAGPNPTFQLMTGSQFTSGGGKVFATPATAPYPIIDIEDDFVFVQGFGSLMVNNVFMTSGGGFVGFVGSGSAYSGRHDWDHPGLVNGYFVNLLCAGGYFPRTYFANADFTPYLSRSWIVNTSGGPINAQALDSFCPGQWMRITDVQGDCGINNVEVLAPVGGGTVDAPYLNRPFQSKTWVSDNVGNWILTGDAYEEFVTADIVADQTAINNATNVVDTTGAVINLTLPLAATAKKGAVIRVANIGGSGNATTMVLSGADTLVGGSGSVPAADNAAYQSDGGTRWVKIS